MITDEATGTRIDEVSDGIYRITTPIPPGPIPGGFSFNRYLLVDDEPLLFHTGPRGMAMLTTQAIQKVIPLDRLRYIGFSHFENDECGALGALLSAAPLASPLCGRVNAMINADVFDKPPIALDDGQSLRLGKRTVQWFDTPHLPHGWECGYLFETHTRTLLCGDLFTQPGANNAPVTRADILAPSEAMRSAMDYFAHAPNTRSMLERLASNEPTTLACMHGSAWQGDGGALLRALASALTAAT
jgi:flavorubredoxin